jgi:hypothetical protein
VHEGKCGILKRQNSSVPVGAKQVDLHPHGRVSDSGLQAPNRMTSRLTTSSAVSRPLKYRCINWWHSQQAQSGLSLCVTMRTASSHVMNVEIFRASTVLAAPTHLSPRLPQSASHRAEHLPNSRTFLRNGITHVLSMEAGCSEAADEKPRAAEHPRFGADPPISRAAPARKSAQIISTEEPRDLLLPRMRAAISSALSTTNNWPL